MDSTYRSERSEYKLIVYDNQFNRNEWFVIVGLFIGIVVVYLLPKRFPRQISNLFFLCGIFTGIFFDHTLSVQPVSYYDVNDVSLFEVMDFISYLMYGPFSYLFFYVYDYFRIKPSFIPIFVLVWSLISIGMECLEAFFGVFHYTNGYKIWYSFPIYLLVQSLWMILYYRYRGRQQKTL